MKSKALLTLPGLILLCAAATAQVRPFVPVVDDQLLFSENKGQWNSRIFYKSEVDNGSISLLANGFSYTLVSESDLKKTDHRWPDGSIILHGRVFNEVFDGSNLQPVLSGNNPVNWYENYFLGNDSTRWASHVQLFPQVSYHQLYSGIDMRVYSRSNGQLEYDFLVQPNADVSQIKAHYDGVEKVQLIKGELKVTTGIGDIIEQKPYAYQEIGGVRKKVACNFVLHENHFAFEFPNGYDKDYELVVDPTIVFSTYTGSKADNWGYTATYDAAGNMYVGGLVNGQQVGDTNYLPTPGAFQTTWGGGSGVSGIAYACDIGISKFSSDGSQLLYRTYIGGSDNETPNSLVTDANGSLFIYGVSYSSNFPVTAGAFGTAYKGGGDIVVVKLNATGSALLGSTYVGGTAVDGMNENPGEGSPGQLKRNYGDQNRGEVNIDATENVYVVSCTKSPDFPTTAGAFQTSKGGGQDGCVFELSSDFTHLVWSSFIGGSNEDACYSMDLAANGNLYVAGGTMSNNFPTTAGVVTPAFAGGNTDGFVACFASGGASLVASTYVGTSGDDQVYGVKLDLSGNVYFVGQTTGTYAVQNARYSNPNSGQFITKLNPQLTSVSYSTVFGNGSGSPNISPTALLVDTCENVYVAGWSAGATSFIVTEFGVGYQNNMSNMPLTADAFQTTTDGSDFYFFVLSRDADTILFGSYFGSPTYGEHVDGGTSRFDKNGVIYEAICGGCINHNSSTPTTPGVWSRTNNSQNCNEMGLKIAFNLFSTHALIQPLAQDSGCAPFTVQFNDSVVNADSVIWYFGDGTNSTATNPQHVYNDTGTYIVTLIGVNRYSCNQSDTATTTIKVVNGNADASFNYAEAYLHCDTLLVTAWTNYPNATSQTWDFGDGTQIMNQDTVTHLYTTDGTYTINHYLYDATKLCKLRDTAQAMVSLSQFSITATAPDSSGCAPLMILFTGQSADSNASYTWNFGDGGTSNTNPASHTFNNQGSYTVVVIGTDSNTCNKTDTVKINVKVASDSVKANFSINILQSCDSLIVQLNNQSVNATQYLWTFGDGNSSAQQNVNYTYTQPATYTIQLVVTNPVSCNLADSVSKQVRLLPNAAAAFSANNGCSADSIFFNNMSPANASSTWFFGDGTVSTLFSPSHLFRQPGSYQVTLSIVDTLSCNVGASVTHSILINQSPVLGFIFLPNDTVEYSKQVTLVSESRDYNQLSWNLGDGFTAGNTDSVTHTYQQVGTIKVCLVASDSICQDTLCKDLYISYSALVGVPNAFSPNGDGINDIITVEGLGIAQMDFRVFNRWGQMVFESVNQAIGWDGTYKGVLQESDVYIYTLDATLVNGESITRKGNITLLR